MPPFRTPRRAAAAVAGLVAAVCAATALPAAAAPEAGPAVPGRYARQHLDWHPCDGPAGLECARMAVPRDWHHPGAGPDLDIAVSRHRAAGAGGRGVLMMAAGGPGGSGLARPADLARRSPAVATAYDIVSFDQRGVGRSTRVRCQTPEEFAGFLTGDARDRSPAALRRTLATARSFAEDCGRRDGALLPYLTTEQTVRDMDLFRSLLGARTVSYYGASYATAVGAYYATLFPHRVERAVLDSNVGFDGSWQRFGLGQPKSFQRRFEQDFLPWLARYDDVYHYGRTAAAAQAKWERQRRALRAHPVTFGKAVIGPDRFDNGTSDALYSADRFPVLASALATLDHWDRAGETERARAAGLLGRAPDPAFYAEYFSVTCADSPWDRDARAWVRRTADDAAKRPLVGARALAFAAVCASWPAPAAPKVTVTGAGLPTVLMLNSVHDPATYYEAAERAHRALRGSRLVTVTGDGDHGQYAAGNPCVDGVVDRYLLDGRAPARDMTCPGKPLPVPAA